MSASTDPWSPIAPNELDGKTPHVPAGFVSCLDSVSNAMDMPQLPKSHYHPISHIISSTATRRADVDNAHNQRVHGRRPPIFPINAR